MENASRALVMAAGVLIAIIVIALVYSFVNAISLNAEQQETRELVKQTEAFNNEYVAFEKKLMRGTDLITVVNKALANNAKYSDQDKVYDIDVVFTLIEPVIQVSIKVDNNVPKKATSKTILEASSYSVIRDEAKIVEFMKIREYSTSDSYIIEPDDPNLSIKEALEKGYYTKKYDVFTTFKRKFFKCTKIEYNSQTGRINKLVFEEMVAEGGTLEGFN